MRYTLQYASNFFLNLHKCRDFNKMLIPSSENLTLLGNICSLDTIENRIVYNNFLEYCSKNYKKIYLVPGVWEMCSIKPQEYNMCIQSLNNIVNQYKNTVLLNNSHVSIPNTDIDLVGSTLWTRTPYLKHECMFEYNYIWLQRHSGIGQIIGNDMINWHHEDLYFIRNMVRTNKKVILLSHHLPHPMLVKDYNRICLESSNLEKQMKKPIEIWLGGAGDHSVTGTFGICRDVFCGVNPYTTFNIAKKSYNESYNPEAYVSLRTSDIQLV